jgi:hypothetical protein
VITFPQTLFKTEVIQLETPSLGHLPRTRLPVPNPPKSQFPMADYPIVVGYDLNYAGIPISPLLRGAREGSQRHEPLSQGRVAMSLLSNAGQLTMTFSGCEGCCSGVARTRKRCPSLVTWNGLHAV